MALLPANTDESNNEEPLSSSKSFALGAESGRASWTMLTSPQGQQRQAPKQAPQCFVSCTPQEFLTFPSWSAGFESQTFFRVLQSFFISKIWKPHLIQISACLTHQDLLQQKALFTDRYLHLAFSYFSLGQIQGANNDIPQNKYWHWSPTSLQIGTGCPKCPCLFLQADTWSGHSASLKMLLSICVVPTNVGWIHHTTWAGDT